MFVSTQSLPQIAREYVSEVIFPKAPTPAMQFGIGFLLPYMDSMIQSKVAQTSPALQALGVIDANGKLDLDKAKSAATTALEKAGGRVVLAGYTADLSDIEALFSIAQRHATNE